MFKNISTKIARLINRAPLIRKEKKFKPKVDNKFNNIEDIPNKNNLKKGIIVIASLIFLFLVVLIVQISLAVFQFNPKPFPDSTQRNKTQELSQGIRTVMFLVLDRPDESHSFVDGLAVLSYNIDTNKISIFTINPDLKIYSTRLGRDLFIRTAFNDIPSKEDKINYFTEGVESLLAIKIDNYIVTDISTFNEFSKFLAPINIAIDQDIKDLDVVNLPDKELKQWGSGNVLLRGTDYLEFLASNSNGRDDQLNRQASVMKKIILSVFNVQNIFNIPNILNSVENGFLCTDITKSEFIEIFFEISQAKDSNINYGYTKAKAYYNIYAVTYYPVFGINFSLLDKDIGDVFSDILIFKEQARIEILNGSSVKGLASNRARWVSNTGARIIKIGNSYESETKTKIYCNDISKYSKTLNAIQRIFNGKAELINKDYNQRHIGDIIIVIGDEY